MSAALLSLASKASFDPEPGLSPRAIKAVYKVYARLADTSGTFKYGIRGSKVAELAEYSIATVRRAQRYLVEHGWLEKVKIGGGRVSTRWRLVLERLGLPGDTTDPPVTQPQSTHETPHRPTGKTFDGSAPRRPPAVAVSPVVRAPVQELCNEHGFTGGSLPSGLPRCPDCRRQVLRT